MQSVPVGSILSPSLKPRQEAKSLSSRLDKLSEAKAETFYVFVHQEKRP